MPGDFIIFPYSPFLIHCRKNTYHARLSIIYFEKTVNMKITSYKTKKVIVGDNLYKILDQSLPLLKERDILAISSKIISICQGRVIKKDGKITKENLIKKEADLILPKK